MNTLCIFTEVPHKNHFTTVFFRASPSAVCAPLLSNTYTLCTITKVSYTAHCSLVSHACLSITCALMSNTYIQDYDTLIFSLVREQFLKKFSLAV